MERQHEMMHEYGHPSFCRNLRGELRSSSHGNASLRFKHPALSNRDAPSMCQLTDVIGSISTTEGVEMLSSGNCSEGYQPRGISHAQQQADRESSVEITAAIIPSISTTDAHCTFIKQPFCRLSGEPMGITAAVATNAKVRQRRVSIAASAVPAAPLSFSPLENTPLMGSLKRKQKLEARGEYGNEWGCLNQDACAWQEGSPSIKTSRAGSTREERLRALMSTKTMRGAIAAEEAAVTMAMQAHAITPSSSDSGDMVPPLKHFVSKQCSSAAPSAVAGSSPDSGQLSILKLEVSRRISPSNQRPGGLSQILRTAGLHGSSAPDFSCVVEVEVAAMAGPMQLPLCRCGSTAATFSSTWNLSAGVTGLGLAAAQLRSEMFSSELQEDTVLLQTLHESQQASSASPHASSKEADGRAVQASIHSLHAGAKPRRLGQHLGHESGNGLSSSVGGFMGIGSALWGVWKAVRKQAEAVVAEQHGSTAGHRLQMWQQALPENCQQQQKGHAEIQDHLRSNAQDSQKQQKEGWKGRHYKLASHVENGQKQEQQNASAASRLMVPYSPVKAASELSSSTSNQAVPHTENGVVGMRTGRAIGSTNECTSSQQGGKDSGGKLTAKLGPLQRRKISSAVLHNSTQCAKSGGRKGVKPVKVDTHDPPNGAAFHSRCGHSCEQSMNFFSPDYPSKLRTFHRN
ncbi:hypothetical protein CEUSTIGMA_g8012.t1 [Chlamydomonas eustigma]|uniref:Uncharacterized protein n=1 Tax=Chlamydomonas eustigma TaxID=1157962 RepID=A0A250XBW4_9CHLO|nr:hypothetical protein CEUSTIGMA_g8012.t1 [Chlamydomonas eustigma]|eukprot:GAX80575.1 hypothetical protein CEUSTIGMA_g8012.t1 [Chlamydomonas eustigma]